MRIFALLALFALAPLANANDWSQSFNNVWDFADKAAGARTVVEFSETDVDGPGTPAGPQVPLVTSKVADDTEETDEESEE